MSESSARDMGELLPSEHVETLIPLVYEELRHLARMLVSAERAGYSLQATALVNEACLRLLPIGYFEGGNTRAFFSVAAKTMRRVLIDRARRHRTEKRGGHLDRVPFEALTQEVAESFGYPELELIDLDAALDRLAAEHPRKAEVLELLFFAGLTRQETADVLGVAARTVQNDWTYARLWLIHEMTGKKHEAPAFR